MPPPTPRDRKYTTVSIWVRMDGDVAVLGICYWMQQQFSGLGSIVNVNFPEVGAIISRLDDAGWLLGEGSTVGFYAPLTGEVLECNEQLLENPGLLNQDY